MADNPCIPKLSHRLAIVYGPQGPIRRKDMLAYLCWAVDALTGQTFRNLERMARDRRVSVSTVKRELHELVREGWIVRRRRPNKSTLTRLCPQRFNQAESATTSHKEAASRIGENEPSEKLNLTHSDGSKRAIGEVNLHPPAAHGEPQSGSLSDSLSGERSSVASQQTQGGSCLADASEPHADDNLLSKLFYELRPEHPDLSRKRLGWAADIVCARAKTQPGSSSYWKKSVSGVLSNLSAEIETWMIQTAVRLVDKAGVSYSRPDLAEELKQRAANCDLPYNSEIVQTAIDKAEQKLNRDRALYTQLNAGRRR